MLARTDEAVAADRRTRALGGRPRQRALPRTRRRVRAVARLAELDHAVAARRVARAVGEAGPGTVRVVGAVAFSAVRFFTPSPQIAAVTVLGNAIAPGPGKPAVWLIAVPLVAGMQKAETRVFVVVPTVPCFTIGSMKHRWFFETQGPFPAGQSLLV